MADAVATIFIDEEAKAVLLSLKTIHGNTDLETEDRLRAALLAAEVLKLIAANRDNQSSNRIMSDLTRFMERDQ